MPKSSMMKTVDATTTLKNAGIKIFVRNSFLSEVKINECLVAMTLRRDLFVQSCAKSFACTNDRQYKKRISGHEPASDSLT